MKRLPELGWLIDARPGATKRTREERQQERDQEYAAIEEKQWKTWRWNHVRFALLAHAPALRSVLPDDVVRLILSELVRLAFTYPVVLEQVGVRKRGRRPHKEPPQPSRALHQVCFLRGIDALHALIPPDVVARAPDAPWLMWGNRGERGTLYSHVRLARMIDCANTTRRDTGEFAIYYTSPLAHEERRALPFRMMLK